MDGKEGVEKRKKENIRKRININDIIRIKPINIGQNIDMIHHLFIFREQRYIF